MRARDCDEQLDATGLSCPLPILRTAQRLAKMTTGQVLHVIATDPGSLRDFPAFARTTGHTLLESSSDDGKFHYWLQRK